MPAEGYSDSLATPRAAGSGTAAATSVLDHLGGSQHGIRQALSETSSHIGTARGAAVHFPAGDSRVAPHHATLIRRGEQYLLVAQPDQHVEVNDEPVTSRLLTVWVQTIVDHVRPSSPW